MLKAIGTSLADVAAFMHEMELHQGYPPRANDGRGIERIRQLAYKLQSEPEDQVGHSVQSAENILKRMTLACPGSERRMILC